MTKPTAVTEAGTAKVMLLADSSNTTPGAYAPAAVTSGTSGEATYPVGWMGVATHRRGELIGSAGGFIPGSAPVVVAAGYDNSAGGTVRALRTDENGILLTRQSNALDLPLQQPTTGTAIAGVAETGFHLSNTTRYSYLQRLQLECMGTVSGGTGAGSWTLKNGTAGTVLHVMSYKLGTPAIGDRLVYEFWTPHKTGGTGGSFTLTPSSTFLGTWNVVANGFYSVL